MIYIKQEIIKMIINDIQIKQMIDNFFINNEDFISLFKDNNPLLLKKIKDYNIEFEVSLIHSNSNIILIKNKFNDFKIYVKYDEVRNKLLFEYNSEFLYFNDENLIITKKIEKAKVNLKNCKIEIMFKNNIQEISFINSPFNIKTDSASGRTDKILSEKKDFNLFKKYVEEYNVNLLKIVQGDETYLKELEQAFEIIFLTDDNFILKEICNDIFNILKIENVLIESKKKNPLNYFNLIKKKITAIF